MLSNMNMKFVTSLLEVLP